MDMEMLQSVKAEIAGSTAYKTLADFFDADSFCEIDAFAKSGDGVCEAVAGYGTVEGLPVYAFAQNSDICGGAMSKAQAAKLKKLYKLALKTGAPVVGFYDSVGGRLAQGTELLAGCGDILNLTAKLSGAVPQISVITGTCLGTNALAAAGADFVIMTEDAKLSLDVTGANAGAACNAENGGASIIAADTDEAVQKARELLCYLPSNNLTSAPEAEALDPSPEGSCMVSKIVDGGSKFKIADSCGKTGRIRLARMGGSVVGVVRTIGKKLDEKSSEKLAKFVRFCDAFSLPVLTVVDCAGFENMAAAQRLISAYAEATTVKISVIVGKAVGSAYIALAGTGSNADAVYALPNAVISPVNVEAAAWIMAPEQMKVPVEEQSAAAEKFAEENLSAFNAAQNGYVDGIVEETELRVAVLSALDMLSGKRVPTVAKKHNTI